MRTSVFVLLLSCSLLASCALSQKKIEESVQPEMPIDCASAATDLATLQEEKVSAAARAGAGVGSIVPIGLVTGIVTGTAGTKARVASGEYNELIEARMKQIEATCGVTRPPPETEAATAAAASE